MNLDFTSLSMSIDSLDRAVTVYHLQNQKHGDDVDLMQVLQAGVIQNFEFAYEQSWKFMKRWLEKNIAVGVADGVTRRELFRLSAESRLINDVEKWMEFHNARNLTSHTYDISKAAQVLSYAMNFSDYAKALLSRLKERN